MREAEEEEQVSDFPNDLFFFPFLATLYNTIYQYVLNSPHIAELTVEDPAEAFEDLRDRNDLKMLLNHEQFMREALSDVWGGSTHGGPVRNQRDREHHHVHPVHHTHAIHSRRHGEGTNGRKKQGEGKLSPPTEKAWAARWKAEFKIAQVRLFCFLLSDSGIRLFSETKLTWGLQRQFQRLLEMLA